MTSLRDKELPKILRPHKSGKISRRQAVKAVKKAMTVLDRRKLNWDSLMKVEE